MNLPKRVPVLANPQDGISIRKVSRLFHRVSWRASFGKLHLPRAGATYYLLASSLVKASLGGGQGRVEVRSTGRPRRGRRSLAVGETHGKRRPWMFDPYGSNISWLLV